MRVCPKCRDYYADRLLGFCLADGTPLVDVDPNSDLWDQAARVIEQKQNVVKTQQRRFKWRRVMLRAMLMTTMVVSVAAVIRSFSVTVVQPTGDLCIREFDDRNGDGNQDPGEAGLSGFEFQVSGTGAAIALKTEKEGDVCRNLPVGTYTVVETPKPGWTPTTETTRTVIVTAGQPAKVLFGSRQEAELCIGTFNDLNGNRRQDAGEQGLPEFDFQVRGADTKTLTTDFKGAICSALPVGTYTVVETPKPGWTATTKTTQTVILTANQAVNLRFGNTKSKPVCSDIDKKREWQIISDRYDASWRRIIEAEPPSVKGGVPILGEIEYLSPSFLTCTTALVTAKSVWKVQSPRGVVPVRKERRFDCVKTGDTWNCN